MKVLTKYVAFDGVLFNSARRERGELRHQRKAKDEAPARQITGPAASADEERTSDFSSQNEGSREARPTGDSAMPADGRNISASPTAAMGATTGEAA
jgi:hypothetical protein